MTVTLSTIKGREADHLLVLSDEYMASLYPAESNHLVSSESLRAGDAAFIGAFLSAQPTPRLGHSGAIGRDDADGVPECVGCVAARFYRDEPYAEIKRLYVAEAHRGGGLARLLMAAIERENSRARYRLRSVGNGCLSTRGRRPVSIIGLPRHPPIWRLPDRSA